MYRLWLIFSQAATVCLAALFVVATLKPEWLPGRHASTGTAVVSVLEPASEGAHAQVRANSYNAAVSKAMPSVVNIFTSKEVRTPRHPLLNDPLFRRFFGEQFGEMTERASSLGSGVIVSPEGYVLTNSHVVEAADEIEVLLGDGKTTLLAKVVGSDPESDIAVLRVNASALPAITFGSSDNLRVGDVVLAIGNPFGVGQTVTSGIVSALGRSQLGINTFENFIQTDAAINPGNSGGALVDSTGNLVGINTAIYSRSGGSLGIGFAIPISITRSVMEQIIKSGSVTRGWIGVEAQEITTELAESFKLPATEGALIAGVMRGSPADRAGIRPGDVLVAVAGKPVKDPQTMLELIAGLAPGTATQFKLRRESKELEVAVNIGKRPPVQRSRE